MEAGSMNTTGQKRSETAEQRLAMIAPLLHVPPDVSRTKQKEEISGQYNVSVRTLDRYYKSYMAGGFDALFPHGKRESRYKIPEDLLNEAIQLRRELPGRSIPSIIQVLELEGMAAPGFLKRTTLQDALERRGYSSRMMKNYSDTGFASQRFQRKHRHDLWQGDIKYGLVLNIGGVRTQTYFSCLIDDCTRYIIHGEFYATMGQDIVEDTMRKAVTKYGAPLRIYFDNGSQYRTHWMKRACALLGIRLLYARPRNPKGKGKQERFNQTLDSFLAEAAIRPPETLQILNQQFAAWLSECYHSKQHSALGTTPEIAFKSDSMPPRYIEQSVLARAFLHCEQRKADKSGCISFNSMKYDLGIAFARRQVDVVYTTQNTETLTIETAGTEPFQVHRLNMQEHVAHLPKSPVTEHIHADHSRLLNAVASAYSSKVQRRRRAISYSSEMEESER